MKHKVQHTIKLDILSIMDTLTPLAIPIPMESVKSPNKNSLMPRFPPGVITKTCPNFVSKTKIAIFGIFRSTFIVRKDK